MQSSRGLSQSKDTSIPVHGQNVRAQGIIWYTLNFDQLASVDMNYKLELVENLGPRL